MNYNEVVLQKLGMDIEMIVNEALREQAIAHQAEIQKKDEMVESLKKQLKESTSIRKDCSEMYVNLDDFCRVTKDLLAVEKNKLKQYLLKSGILCRDEIKGVYVPNKNDSQFNAKIQDGMLYIKDSYIRKMLAIRSFTAIGDETSLEWFFKSFTKKRDILIENMSNTVFVEYKQNSYEFRNLESSMYDLLNK
ncbi:MAG: hypothetical protein ACRCZ9_08665 [Fusobacteriaceae bacterium]